MNWRQVRVQVINRDGGLCVDCSKSEDRMAVHHLDRSGDWVNNTYSNNDMNNLVTVCYSCHLKRHWAMVKKNLFEDSRQLTPFVPVSTK